MPSAQPARWSSAGSALVLDPGHVLDVGGRVGEQRVELSRADDAERDLRREPRRGEDRLQAVQRDQLADEQARERLLRRPARLEEPLLGADEADGDAVRVEAGEPGEVVGVRLACRRRRGRRERSARRSTRRERARRERAGPEAPAVGDERVRERDERVEDDRRAAGGPPRRRQVEVPGIADDDRVEALVAAAAQEPRLGDAASRAASRGPARQPSRRPSQTGSCRSRTSTPARAQTRDHLRVPRVVALVRAEVERPSRAGQDFVDHRLRPRALVGALLVLARDHLADQPEREKLDADDDEQHAEDQQRPAADRVALRLERRSGRQASRPPPSIVSRPSPPNRCSGRWR